MEPPSGIRQTVKAYLDAPESFQLYGWVHWVAILTTLLLACALPVLAKTCLSRQHRVRLGIVLGILVAVGYFVRMFLEGVAGTLDLTRHLPLHMCWLSCLMLPFTMSGRRPQLFEVVFYWGLAGGIQGIVTPINKVDFPHFHFLYYFCGHNLLVVALVYAVAVYGMRPTAAGIGRAFLAANGLLAICIPVNLLLDANYLFLCGKPEVKTLLDHMGPWPWYIVVGELVALLHFAVAYLPIGLIQFLETKKLESPTIDQDC